MTATAATLNNTSAAADGQTLMTLLKGASPLTVRKARLTVQAIANGSSVASALSASSGSLTDSMSASQALQVKIAIQNIAMQQTAKLRSMMIQAVRDLIKDAKDQVRNQGDAGLKP